MKNWKHSMSAFLAVVMVGSLATIQVKDSSVARADEKESEIEEQIVEELYRIFTHKVQ